MFYRRKSIILTRANVKNGKLPAKLAGEIPSNKLWVYLIFPYKTFRIGKDPLILKSVTITDRITGWFKVTQYDDNKLMVIKTLVETK